MKEAFDNFIEIYKGYILNAIKFQGRTDRTHFWTPIIANAIVTAILGCISSEYCQTAANIIGVLTFIPTLSVGCRRLQDTNRGPLWILINLIPVVGWIIYFIFVVQGSVDEGNKYGSEMVQ